MSAKKSFLDTNILVYTFDQTAPKKQKIAQSLVEQALSEEACISYQVIQEFTNLALRKFSPAMSHSQAQEYLEQVLFPICNLYPSKAFYKRGLKLQERWRFSWYDSLIICAALESGCEILYSEDLQHQKKIETLTIINPFIT
jgi:predicted nucleic acid-binding protein